VNRARNFGQGQNVDLIATSESSASSEAQRRLIKYRQSDRLERPRYGAVSDRGHIVPASTYSNVAEDQELRPDWDGKRFSRGRHTAGRLVLMRGSHSRMVKRYSLGWSKCHPNGYALVVFRRWLRCQRITAFSRNSFEQQTVGAAQRLTRKYDLTRHFHDRLDDDLNVQCDSTVRRDGRIFDDALRCWFNGEQQWLRLPELIRAGLPNIDGLNANTYRCNVLAELAALETKRVNLQAAVQYGEHIAQHVARHRANRIAALATELRLLRRQIAKAKKGICTPEERKLLYAIYELNIVSKGELNAIVRQQRDAGRAKRLTRAAARTADRLPA
jgi:hypothetical protein